MTKTMDKEDYIYSAVLILMIGLVAVSFLFQPSSENIVAPSTVKNDVYDGLDPATELDVYLDGLIFTGAAWSKKDIAEFDIVLDYNNDYVPGVVYIVVYGVNANYDLFDVNMYAGYDSSSNTVRDYLYASKLNDRYNEEFDDFMRVEIDNIYAFEKVYLRDVNVKLMRNCVVPCEGTTYVDVLWLNQTRYGFDIFDGLVDKDVQLLNTFEVKS